MKNSVVLYLSLLIITITYSSCELVGDIFKAGFWSAFIVIGLVIALIIYLFNKMGRRKDKV